MADFDRMLGEIKPARDEIDRGSRSEPHERRARMVCRKPQRGGQSFFRLLYLFEIKRYAAAVNQFLKDLVHVPADLEN
jgi:hypothetical protein